MHKYISTFVLLMFLTASGLQSQVTEPQVKNVQAVKHRVVIQLSSNDTLAWKGLMNNLKNLKEGWGDSVQVEVVAHGNGIQLLMAGKTTQLENIRKFKAMGIDFVGCENTLRERKISKTEIIPEAGFVKMGIGEIILRQEEGWTYIKSGF